MAIRDYYDLWYIAEADFDFYQDKFTKLFKKKLSDENYAGDYSRDFGLSGDKIALLHKQVETDLMPVIQTDEKFDLDKVLERFNVILQKI